MENLLEIFKSNVTEKAEYPTLIYPVNVLYAAEIGLKLRGFRDVPIESDYEGLARGMENAFEGYYKKDSLEFAVHGGLTTLAVGKGKGKNSRALVVSTGTYFHVAGLANPEKSAKMEFAGVVMTEEGMLVYLLKPEQDPNFRLNVYNLFDAPNILAPMLDENSVKRMIERSYRVSAGNFNIDTSSGIYIKSLALSDSVAASFVEWHNRRLPSH